MNKIYLWGLQGLFSLVVASGIAVGVDLDFVDLRGVLLGYWVMDPITPSMGFESKSLVDKSYVEGLGVLGSNSYKVPDNE